MRGSSEHHDFVHPALRAEHSPGKGRPGPGSLMAGGGENNLFFGEEGAKMRKPMEFRVNLISKPRCLASFVAMKQFKHTKKY